MSSIEVSYTIKDEQNFQADGYEKMANNLTCFNFGDMYLWVKKINRNAQADVDNEDTSIMRRLLVRLKNDPKRSNDVDMDALGSS